MAALTSLLAAVAFRPLGPAVLPQRTGRAPAVAMREYSLNNFPLPGPIKPVNSQTLVKQARADESTKGGLFLASDSAEKPREGIVVAAGDGRVHPDTGVVLPIAVRARRYDN
jgi:chaperonin GroES